MTGHHPFFPFPGRPPGTTAPSRRGRRALALAALIGAATAAGQPRARSQSRATPNRATRLFASGFERGVTLTPATGNGNADQYLRGQDIRPYRWGPNLWRTPQPYQGWILSVVGNDTPAAVTAYCENTIRTVRGRQGNLTRALSLHSQFQSPNTDVQQITLQNVNMAVEPVFYERGWLKFDVNTLSRAQAVGSRDFWQMFWEMKAEPDYRIRLQLQYTDAGRLYWQAQGDVLANADPLWHATLTSVPVVLVPPDRPEGWHKLEVWMDRPNGRFRAAIDGVLLVDRRGNLWGASRSRTNQLKFLNLYSNDMVTEVLFDDFELWSAPPSDAWRS